MTCHDGLIICTCILFIPCCVVSLILAALAYTSCNELVDNAQITFVTHSDQLLNSCTYSVRYTIYNGGVYTTPLDLPCTSVKSGTTSISGCYRHFAPEIFSIDISHYVPPILTVPLFIIGGFMFNICVCVLVTTMLSRKNSIAPFEPQERSGFERRDSARELNV